MKRKFKGRILQFELFNQGEFEDTVPSERVPMVYLDMYGASYMVLTPKQAVSLADWFEQQVAPALRAYAESSK